MTRKDVLAAVSLAMLLTVSLAACGGGGSGTPGPSPSPSVAPSPTLPPGSPHPALDGDTFAFSGTSSRTIQRFQPTPPPPPQVINSAITQNQTVHTGATFHGAAATDFKATEVDAGPNQTLTVNSDNYVQLPAATGNLLNLGFHSTDSNGATLDEDLTPSNFIFDELPQTVNATWSNSALAGIVATDPDGTTINETVNPNGSYTETIADPVVGNTTATQNSDGSGTIDTPSTAFFTVGTGMHIAVSPVSGNQITFTISSVGAAPPTPAPIIFTLPAWYAQSPTLAFDQFTDMGLSAMPAGCDSPAFGARGVQLREVKTRLDTLFGTNESETVDTWIVPSIGPACMRTADSVNLFYDFTGQTVNGVFASTATQTTTLAETVGLQSETIHAAARHPASLTPSSLAATALQFAYAQNRVERLRQNLRMRQAHALRTFLPKRGLLK